MCSKGTIVVRLLPRGRQVRESMFDALPHNYTQRFAPARPSHGHAVQPAGHPVRLLRPYELWAALLPASALVRPRA